MKGIINMNGLSTHAKGLVTELTVQKEFIKHGFGVSVPLLPTSRYDMIVDIYGNLFKVQVKTSRPIPDSDGFKFKLRSTQTHRWGVTEKQYERNEVDMFATVYNNNVYIVPQYLVDGKAECYLRNSSANNQVSGIMFAKNFELDNVVDKIKALNNNTGGYIGINNCWF